MSEIDSLIENIYSTYRERDPGPFPYVDVRKIQTEFHQEFRKYAPDAIFTADLNTYWMFIDGLASGRIRSILADALERYKTKELLEKSFFDWFTKYRFLETHNLSNYPDFFYSLSFYDDLRQMLLNLIKAYELKVKGQL